MRKLLALLQRPAGGPRNPYLQAAVINVGLGIVVVAISAATGRPILRVVVAVLLAWVIGTLYTWMRVRQRERLARRRDD